MSVDIDLKQPDDSGSSRRGRNTGILAVLLAGLFLVGAATAGQLLQNRGQQAGLASPSASVTLAAVEPSATTTSTQTSVPTATPSAVPTAVTPAPVQGSPTLAMKQTGTPATVQPTIRASQTVTATARLSQTPATATRTASPTRTLTSRQASATATFAKASRTPSPTATAKTPAPAPTLVPAATGAYTWYFADGSSKSPARTWYSILNPGSQPATVTVALYPEAGLGAQRAITVAAGTQARVDAGAIMSNAAFGAAIRSDQSLYVERLTAGERDGITASGMAPSKVWYFPEGQTDDDFSTWLLLLNPGATAAKVQVTYLPVGSAVITRTFSVQPMTRLSVPTQKDLPVSIMGMTVESDTPIVAEHSVYFDSQKAAYGGPGLPALSKTWYVAGGNTQEGFVTRLTLLNPGNEQAKIKATFLASTPPSQTGTFTLTAQSKDDIVLNDRADGQIVSVILESDRPIAAETVTYYYSGAEMGPIAAYSAPALAAPATLWYLPETSSAATYDSYIMLLNPGQAAAKATVSYVTESGEATTKSYDLPLRGRLTLRVSDEVKGKVVVAASLSSTQPIVAERVTMFRASVGATSSAGIAGQ